MSRVEFKRVDLRFIVRRGEGDNFLIKFGFPGRFTEKRVGADDLKNWLANPESASGFLLDDSKLKALAAEKERREKRVWERASNQRMEVVLRLALDVTDPELAMSDWERLLNFVFQRELLKSLRIVRVSPVKPRVSSMPFTLPLRMLQVLPSPVFSLEKQVREVFGSHLSEDDLAQAVQVDRLDFENFGSPHLSLNKPTIEILHFDRLPTLDEPEILLSTAFPEKTGTFGWFMRAIDSWQTRLIIINCAAWQTASARKLAAAIVNRGGPAIIVSGFQTENEAAGFYNKFYDLLIHDFALDFAATNGSYAQSNENVSFFGGSGREELLRISTLGEKLIDIGKALAPERRKNEIRLEMNDLVARNLGVPAMSIGLATNIVTDCVGIISSESYAFGKYTPLSTIGIIGERLNELRRRLFHFANLNEYEIDAQSLYSFDEKSSVSEVVEIVHRNAVPLVITQSKSLVQSEIKWSVDNISDKLRNLKNNWNNYKFEFREGEGYVPLSREITVLRENAGVKQAVSYEEVAPKSPAPRFVNSSLWNGGDGSTKLIEQAKAGLIVGRTYHLGIQIGPKDARIFTLGATALIEEVFKWTPEMSGTWVEIGVTGIDFEVLGDPVQELWLPQKAPSDIIYFAVVPRTEQVARLRFCLYHKQNLVQSFRLAALTRQSGKKEPSAQKRKKILSQALGVQPRQIGDYRYLSRLEYSLTASLDEVEKRPERSLSILVNDLNGESRITVKGVDQFETRHLGNDLPAYVTAVRSKLKEISYVETKYMGNVAQDYAFPENASTAALKEALKKLALVGWELFDKVIPGNEKHREKLASTLESERRIIQIASVLREKVIPWAAIYDRQYRPDKEEDANLQPVAQDVCLAAMPDKAGILPAQKCKALKECLLHPDQVKQREAAKLPPFCDETVVCPLHFWGFKHIIEIPPQQVKEDKTHPQKDRILSTGKIQLLAGINSQLKLGGAHWSDLEKISTSVPNAEWKPKITRREPLLEALKDENIDFIYLYCHARGGIDDQNIIPPYLEFHDDVKQKSEQITPASLGSGEWKHQPLVFLNGCGTVGFSPDAISPFIDKIVDDRCASGILGTEVTVWEELAKEAALLFLKEFLTGESAGDALLDMRRILLARNNPLGLVYTLYAAAHLKIETNKGV